MPALVMILVPLFVALLRSYPALRETAEELSQLWADLRAENRDATPEEVDAWLARAERAARRLQELRDLPPGIEEIARGKVAGS